MLRTPLLRARLLTTVVALAGVIAGLAAAEPAYAASAPATVPAPAAPTAGVR